MAHRDWCGKSCCDCDDGCWLDKTIPCSPDCENLSEDGKPNSDECKNCDAYEMIAEFGCLEV